ncbi:MAG: hypothetical protein PUP92_26120 [Rhizonema sp. PD38]|nr:hypothetical protein [Rhizonema sp. PD38]
MFLTRFWDFGDSDRWRQGIHEHGAFPKIYRWSSSCIRKRALQLGSGDRRIRSRFGELVGSRCGTGLVALMVLNVQGDPECQGKDEGKDAPTIYWFVLVK